MESKRTPSVSIKIIFKCGDRIMMFRHKDGVNDFPGGTMEWGESIMETLRRELREELDYNLKKEPELVDVYNHVSKDGMKHKVLIQYILKLGRMPKFESLEGVEYFWLDKKEARRVFSEKSFLDKIFNY